MKIDRNKVRTAFADYVRHYNDKDEKIRLKIVHTYHVAQISDRICDSLSLTGEQKDLAWLIAMLHDIGRFEQLRRFGTFQDAVSIDHAAFGTELLFEQNLIRSFTEDATEDATIKTAIAWHNQYRFPDSLDDRTRLYVQLIRDADKVDIFRVCSQTPLEEIYNVTHEEAAKASVTPAVLNSFMERHAVLHSLKKTPADHIVGHASLAFELVYPESARITQEQGFIYQMLQIHSDNPDTLEKLSLIRDTLSSYLKERCSAQK